ncbi:MAG TPA: CpsB/CapC family capsule biosynthesis tyrosine phosphatase [Chitinophagaceae bacterium]|nr:CpsB/CapC family capsule biosynthesis tyrosine phosphatase [Chitinophagaceae bacterium]
MLKIFSKAGKSRPRVDYSFLKTDMHSHLVPGIDDGSPDTETSQLLIRGLADLGFQKLITTPHVMWDMYRNDKPGISEKFSALKAEGIQLSVAAEYFLDDHFTALLREGAGLLTLHENKVLVEFSLASPSLSLKEILFNLQMQGYQPVIAHPERYLYLEQGKEFFDELKRIGCLFQLNILSLGSYYGRSVHELAQYLIKKDYYELAGTDLHHVRHLEALRDPALIPPLKRLVDSGKVLNANW